MRHIQLNNIERIIALLCVLMAIFASLYFGFDFRLTERQICYYAIAFLTFYVFFCVGNNKYDVLSPVMLLIHYMVVEAIGIPLSIILTPQYAHMRINRSKMFYGEYLDKYVLLSTLAILILLLAILMFGKHKEEQTLLLEYEEADSASSVVNYYYQIGLFLLVIFAVYVVFGSLTGRIALFNYSEYKTNSDRLMNYLLRGYWFGTIFIAASGTKKQIFKAVPWFAVGSLVLLLAGNRNDIYYPLLVALGLYKIRFKKIPKLFLITIVILIMFASPLIITLRNGGNIEGSSFSPISLLSQSLFELGGQLTAASHMFNWVEQGDKLALGMTYLLGTVGSIVYPLHTGINTLIESSAYWIGSKISAIGFAMFAEVYYNFSLLGIIVVYFILGKLLAKQTEASNYQVDDLVMKGYMYFWLFLLVRNSYSYTFTYFMMFLVVYAFEKILRFLIKSI